MAISGGKKLPDEVVSLCGIHGVRLTDVVEYRVGEEFVTLINRGGQKFTSELVRLNPPEYAAKSRPQSPPRSGGKAKAKPKRKRPSRAQKVLIDVSKKPD